ncbi:Large subunit GTPase 1 like protein [Argiope bruennichi]|uniref:Large subunit GTPase 1 homolog n=1 Tax=Argiope bruennichi TaxID=94029 RepID=A0A8T0EEM0_ARGBR|nr:Large subunit GTPase 1 like protein [Argiope bruennichi]
MPRDKSGLGNALINAHKRKGKIRQSGFRHTSELPDGRNFGRLNLKSVTEQTSLNELLDTATLAEKDYVAEMSNLKIIDPTKEGLPTEEELAAISSIQEENKEILCIPRRPYWDINRMTKEEIDDNEKIAFQSWRKKIALFQESKNITMTPFEKNIEVWRQLWRVIERSDLVVQIIDARNPLLFQCPDLESYVKEINENKMNMLLLNKADLLTESQRKLWCDYFDEIGIKVVFFSALEEGQRPTENSDTLQPENFLEGQDSINAKNSPTVLSREELLQFFKQFVNKSDDSQHKPSVGLVGYPNVGKSSTLNALLMTQSFSKKAGASATPGKTKHFQTFNLDNGMVLCDCPGLVFPNFVSTKAEMVVNGILPIDQLTGWKHPMTLISFLINLWDKYSLSLLAPRDGKNLTAEELLDAYGLSRGFMTQKGGLPDHARSARYILKDFVNGKLLYCHAPPGVKQEDFHKFPEVKQRKPVKETAEGSEKNSQSKVVLTAADREFFSQMHSKGNPKPEVTANGTHKPWKKHNNRNKKEKLRRVYNPYTS